MTPPTNALGMRTFKFSVHARYFDRQAYVRKADLLKWFYEEGWCPMCGAAPGQPCTIISGDPELGEKPGDVRQETHFYRGNDIKEQPRVAVADEPPFYVGDPKPGGGTYTQADALAWADERAELRVIAESRLE